MMQPSYDLIIIGAGAMGTFHAYHAGLMGKKVLVVERDQQPVNATVRNFGMVIASGMSGKWFDYGVYATQLYKTIQQRHNISVRNNGSLYIASEESEQKLIHALKLHYDTIGYHGELLTQKQLLDKHPALNAAYCKEALYFPQEVSVEPNLFIHRLHDYIAGTFSNLKFLMSAAAIDCSISANEVIVTMAGGQQFRAAKVAICSGHEFKLLFPALFGQQKLSVSKLQMLRTKPNKSLALEGNIATGLSIRRYEAFTSLPEFGSITTPEPLRELENYGIHILFKKAIDGSLIIGDSHQYRPAVEKEQLGYHLDQHINNLMLNEAKRIANIDTSDITESWAGYYSLHDTEEIFEHTIDDKIFIATGIGGKGMTCSAGFAEENIRRIFDN
ncbi:TIGR03364 family FAD-dependent oxidoreductase [Dyadobacter sp. LJ53]|uniref:TIGR03364 family FAD-dependent oxidoreductase n=1 Tax=Dyadobacter chenwenxiniae TaxID=2906456 RepID=UPI001F225843|nr:TIGR03364 family FAD-dependent oxidoreductase [Dyadobacter chenwenxiniae]MCF0051712.1 TIGR03364 family FAD-dependent oxidoreductase [Dyadobacter chenwenxiniae]